LLAASIECVNCAMKYIISLAERNFDFNADLMVSRVDKSNWETYKTAKNSSSPNKQDNSSKWTPDKFRTFFEDTSKLLYLACKTAFIALNAGSFAFDKPY